MHTSSFHISFINIRHLLYQLNVLINSNETPTQQEKLIFQEEKTQILSGGGFLKTSASKVQTCAQEVRSERIVRKCRLMLHLRVYCLVKFPWSSIKHSLFQENLAVGRTLPAAPTPAAQVRR